MTINKTFQKFIGEVLLLAEGYCGKNFTKELQSLRIERERLLNNIWREDIFPEKLELYQKDMVFRDIDFDTTIHYAYKYLTIQEYLELLYEIAEISIKYGEFQKGEHLLQLIITKHSLHTDKKLLAKVHQRMGFVNYTYNDFKTSNKHFNKSLQLFTLLNDTKGTVAIKNDIGILMIEQGNLSEGEALFKEGAVFGPKFIMHYLSPSRTWF